MVCSRPKGHTLDSAAVGETTALALLCSACVCVQRLHRPGWSRAFHPPGGGGLRRLQPPRAAIGSACASSRVRVR